MTGARDTLSSAMPSLISAAAVPVSVRGPAPGRRPFPARFLRRSRRVLAAGALVPALTQCGGREVLGDMPPTSCDLADYDPTGGVVGVATFWTKDEERKAFDVLTAAAGGMLPSDEPQDAQRPDYAVSVTPRRNRDHQQTSLKDWLVKDSDPLPDTFQVNGGSDVLQWVDEGPLEATQLCPLTRLDEAYGFSGFFFASTLEPVSCRGTLYGLPIGVHRLNMLFYNQDLIDRLLTEAESQGVPLQRPEEIATVDEFLQHIETIAALEVESEGGVPVIPLALDAMETWPSAVLAFENLMTARGGGLYEAVWMGQEAAHASEGSQGVLENGEDSLRAALSRVVADLQALSAHSNLADEYREYGEPFHLEGGFRWRSALDMVAGGQAAYTVMGDWGWARVRTHEQVVQSILFPGTEHAFIYTPDSFAVPRRGGADGSRAHFWLKEVVADVETQIAFADAKQSIPAVRDLSDEEIEMLASDRLAAGYREFARCQTPGADCQLLLAVSGLGPSPAADPCFDEVGWLLARTAGFESQEEREARTAGAPRGCNLPLPEDPDAAGEELVERLLNVSREPFAAACR